VAAARNAFFIAGQSNPASVPGALALLKPYDFTPDLVPESMKAFEVGYKGLFGKRVLLDAFFYYSKYRNFIGQAFVAQSKPVEGASDRTKLLNPGTTQVYSVSVNNPGDVNALGGGLSVDVLLTKAFSLNTNVSYNELSDAPADFFTQFNTPKYRFNLGLSNSEVFRNVGFNVVYRYQSSFLYEGTFAVGDVPAFGTLDAQISHKWPKQKIMAKLGATNLLNKYYNNAFGNPAIGGLYYISVGYNVF
jgi:outer membrane receptor protein involved in Fe transport